MNLFENIERTFKGPASHNENTFDYYQRSARKDIKIIRHKLNEWFNNYPDYGKIELKNSFREHFDDCFYELFLFQLFRELGFKIEVHPSIQNSTKKPDFLIIRDGLEIYVEAKIVKDKSNQQEAIERKINKFYDEFSKIKIKGILLSIEELTIKTKKQPSTKSAIAHIEKKIQKINPEILAQRLEKYGVESIPKIEFENNDIRIIIKPIPITNSTTDEEDKRPIGIYPSVSFWGGGEKSLRESISHKAKRYGKLNKPFIVCINSLDIKTSGKSAIDNAIWGSLAISWSENPNNRAERLIRKRDGVFLNDKGPRLKNLSGVFVTKINPHSIPHSEYWLYKNPFSTNELDFNKLGLNYNYYENGRFVENVGNDLGKILNISKEWISN